MDYKLPPKRCLLYCSIMNNLFRVDPKIQIDGCSSVKKIKEVRHGKIRLQS